MADKYWIKLWIEILSDPKIARLPDDQWRKFIEFLLLAGYRNEDGKLPTIDEMAWQLHKEPEIVESYLQGLSKIGVVHKNGNDWIVTKFSKRQETSQAKSMRKLRAKNKEIESNSYSNSERNSYTSDSSSTSTSDSFKLKESPRFPEFAGVESCTIYAEALGWPKYKKQAKAISDRVGDLSLWRATIDHWIMHGWSDKNAGGVLQLYERGGPDACETCKLSRPKNGKTSGPSIEELYPTFHAGDER